ncbi:MAG: hypothetical protein ACR2PR_08765 [Pseudohongiellaceae bacterium]
MTAGKVYSPGDVIIAYQKVAQTEEGQVMLHDLVRNFGFAQSSIAVVANFDPVKMQVIEGQRSVVAYIGAKIESSPAVAEAAGTTVTEDVDPNDDRFETDDDADLW